jgi:hypothetical protein
MKQGGEQSLRFSPSFAWLELPLGVFCVACCRRLIGGGATGVDQAMTDSNQHGFPTLFESRTRHEGRVRVENHTF